MEQIVSFFVGGSAVTDSSCELVETKQGSESRKPLDDLGESFPELDKFVDSYQYYEGDRNILSGPGRFFTCWMVAYKKETYHQKVSKSH